MSMQELDRLKVIEAVPLVAMDRASGSVRESWPSGSVLSCFLIYSRFRICSRKRAILSCNRVVSNAFRYRWMLSSIFFCRLSTSPSVKLRSRGLTA